MAHVEISPQESHYPGAACIAALDAASAAQRAASAEADLAGARAELARLHQDSKVLQQPMSAFGGRVVQKAQYLQAGFVIISLWGYDIR